MKNALKFVGVLLFVLIVIQINWTNLIMQLTQVNVTMFFLSFPVLLLMYVWKALRWHTIVRSFGLHPTIHDSWHVYNIGTFLGIVTPAKIGEFGRAAYLKTAGLSNARSFGIVILDRIADIAMIGLLAIAAIGILFGREWTGIGMVACLFVFVVAYRMIPRQYFPSKIWMSLLFWTFMSWVTYFAWALIVAYAIGINLAPHILISIFVITGIVALLPIAPSGLGTRDAALITLLNLYGIPPEQAVALALLMFVSIVASSAIGGYYWMRQ